MVGSSRRLYKRRFLHSNTSLLSFFSIAASFAGGPPAGAPVLSLSPFYLLIGETALMSLAAVKLLHSWVSSPCLSGPASYTPR